MKFLIKSLWNTIHILVICFVGQLYCAVCPAPADIQPCVCDSVNSQVICSGNKPFDLKQVFNKISANGGKHFDNFYLTNSAITSLEDNVFSNISFKKISINGAYGLTKVSKWSLNASAHTLEEFKQMGENALNDDNIEDLFHALSTLVVVNRIFLELTKATKVPDNAFKVINGRQTQLNSIHLNYIGGKYGSLQSIGNKAFYYLDNLNYISIANQPIKHLKAQAFDFEKSSDVDLDLHMEATKVTANGFEAGIFLNAKRAMTIEMSMNEITYFDEKVFKPVFALPDSVMVSVIVEKNPIECYDCKNEWLVKDKDRLKYRVNGADCRHSDEDIFSRTVKDFAKCHNSTQF